MGLLDQLKNAGSAIIKDVLQQDTAEEQKNLQAQMKQATESLSGLYNPQLEKLIDIAFADGVLTEKEKQILFKKAQAMGIDLDEFEMVLDAKLVILQNKEKEKTAKSAPKSAKYGDVRKCPQCGAVIQTYMTKCSQCGYEFENVEAGGAIKELSQLLRKTSSFKWGNVVKSFSIPSTKSDFIDFLTFLHSNAVKEPDSDYGEACKAKLEECIVKSHVIFSEDKQIQQLIDNIQKEEKRQNKLRIYKKVIPWVIILCLIACEWLLDWWVIFIVLLNVVTLAIGIKILFYTDN